MYRELLKTRILFFGLFWMLGLGIIFYFVLGVGTNFSVTQTLLDKQQILARAESGNISSFFQSFGNSVSVLSNSTSPKSDMDAFVEQWRSSGHVGGVVLTDRNGVVTANSNVLGTVDLGATLGDRDYFIWAKNNPKSGEYFVGQPVISRIGATKGRMIVPVAASVYENNVFAGAMIASVELHSLAQHYLELMKISDLTDVYLVNKNGDLLYSNLPSGVVGLNIFESLSESPFSNSQSISDYLKNALSVVDEGNLKASYLDAKTDKEEEHLIAYSPVLLGNQNWLLIISSPAQEVHIVTIPIYIRAGFLMLFVVLAVFLFRKFKYRFV